MTRTPQTSFTRPADTTAYTSADLVANSVTAGSVVPLSFTIDPGGGGGNYFIRRARLKKSGTGVTNASFRLHLYLSSPTAANGDNAAWSTTESAYIGSFDITIDKAFTDGAKGVGAPLVGSEVHFNIPPSGIVYGLVEARGAYTPTSAEVFTATLEAYPAEHINL